MINAKKYLLIKNCYKVIRKTEPHDYLKIKKFTTFKMGSSTILETNEIKNVSTPCIDPLIKPILFWKICLAVYEKICFSNNDHFSAATKNWKNHSYLKYQAANNMKLMKAKRKFPRSQSLFGLLLLRLCKPFVLGKE